MDPSYLGRPIQAPTARKSSGIMTKKTFLILIGFVVAIITGIVLLASSGDSSAVLQQRLAARQATTLKIIADGQKNISAGDLDKLNSELSVILLSDNNALQSALSGAGFKKIDKAIAADEADTATFEKLKSAKLNAQYDLAYRSVLTQKLESLRGVLKELHSSTSNKALKEAASTEYEHLGGYLSALDELES